MQESNAARIQRQLATEVKPFLSGTARGQVIAQDWDNGFVTVDVGGGEQRMGWIASAPWVGDIVQVFSMAGAVFCAAVYGAAMGTVQSTGSGFATVLADDGQSYRYPHVGSAPSNGSRVRLDHAGRAVLSTAYPVEPADSEFRRPVAPPPPSGNPTGGEAWFNPVWSGNWRGGAYSGSAVEISSTRTGLYGYGRQIADTIPDSATLLVCNLHLVRTFESSVTTSVNGSMGTHGFNGLPGSASNSSLSGSYSVQPGATVVNLLGTVGNQLKTGAALGVGFRSGSFGWRTYAAAPGSGRIYVRWS